MIIVSLGIYLESFFFCSKHNLVNVRWYLYPNASTYNTYNNTRLQLHGVSLFVTIATVNASYLVSYIDRFLSIKLLV